jgi:hypothetical protein
MPVHRSPFTVHHKSLIFDKSGKLMFYMLFYALLRIDRLGQRGLADVFSSPMLKVLFH